ncbi:hypothetical protein ABG067_000224 [Albugo candida]
MSSTGSTDSTGLRFSQRDSMENVSPRSPSSATFSSQHTKENVLQTLSNDMASVQNQLRAMEYTEPLSFDSVPLVHHLLTDIVHITERNSSLETSTIAFNRECEQQRQMLSFLQQENTNLIQENNSVRTVSYRYLDRYSHPRKLHLELIQQEESLSERENACHLNVQSARDEVKHLLFTNNQLIAQLRDKDQTIENLRNKMEILLQTEALQTAEIPPLPPRIEITGEAFLPETKPKSPQLLHSNDKKRQLIAQLENSVQTLTKDHTALQKHCDLLQAQLQARDLEIKRLASKMSTERHHTTPQQLASLPTNTESTSAIKEDDVQVEQLNAHIDFLTDQTAKYEAKLAQVSGRLRVQEELSTELRRFQQLCEELQRENEELQGKLLSTQQERDELMLTREQETDPEATTPEMEQLIQQKNRLEDALRACHYDKISYTNALNNAMAHNRVLLSDLSQTKAQAQALQSQQNRLQQQLSELQTSYLSQTRELELTRSNLSAVEEQLRLESEKNVSLHRELRSMDTVLNDRDQETQRLNRVLASRDGEMERLIRERDNAHAKMEDDAAPGHRYRSLIAQERKWLQQEREQNRQQRQKLMEDLVEAEKRIQESKLETQVVEMELKKLEESNRMLQLEREQAQHALEDKMALIRVQLTEIETLQNENALLRVSKPDASRVEALETASIRLESEVVSLRKQSESLRDENTQLCARLDASKQTDRRLQEELLRFQKEIALLEQNQTLAQREKEEWMNKYEKSSLELRSALQRAQYLETQYEQLTSDMECKQLGWTHHQAAMDRTKSLEMTQQLQEAQNRLKFVSSQFHEMETQMDREKREHQSAQKRIVLLEEELSQARQSHNRIEALLLETQSRNAEKDELLLEKASSLEQSKALLDRMQSSRDEADAHVGQVERELERVRLQLEEARGRSRTHEETSSTLLSELSCARQSLEAIEQENDSLHDQMDTLMEKIAGMETAEKKMHEQHAMELGELNQTLNQKRSLEDRMEQTENRLVEMESAVRKGRVEIDRLEQERLLEIHERKALLTDLENMTSENQNVSEECSMMRVQLGQMEERAVQLKQRIQMVERLRDGLEVERDDLESTLRSVAKQLEGVQIGRNEMSRINEELTSVNEALRKRIEEMERGKEAEGVKSSNYQLEITTYRDQISHLTDQLREKEEALAGARARELALEGAVTTQRSISTEISAQRYGAEAQRAASAQKIVQMEAKIGSFQLESKRFRDQIQMEQVRNAKLEGVATLVRQKLAEKEAELTAMKEQRDVLARELESVYGSAEGRRCSPDMLVADLYMTPDSAESAELGMTGTRSERTDGTEKSPVLLPICALLKAQEKCKELEEQLHRQDSTIQQLERSRSKFKRFAAKYEQEIEQRDRLIEVLQSSAGSSGRASQEPEEEKEHWPMHSENATTPQALRLPSSAEAIRPTGRQRPKRRQRNM